MTRRLSLRQRACLHAIADGSLPWVSSSGDGTFSARPFAPNTYLALEERGLVERRQDDKNFWKLHVTITAEGAATLAALPDG